VCLSVFDIKLPKSCTVLQNLYDFVCNKLYSIGLCLCVWLKLLMYVNM